METPNPKCLKCRTYWVRDENDIKTSGLPYNTCQKCRETSKKYREKNADKIKNINKNYYEENKDKIAEQKKNYYEENPHKLKEKDKKYYEKNKDKIKEYHEKNGDKIKEYQKKYYEENADKIKEYQKKYQKKHYEDNPDKMKEIRKKYYDNNKDKIKEYYKKRRKEGRYKCEHNKEYGRCKICNLQLYLINLQRKQLWRCLKNSPLNKTKSSIEYLGCNAEYFIEYIKKKMDIWNETNEVKMDFTNIHIDHIKPVSSFNLDDEDEFLDCCNYTNMQPLLVDDNLSKHNKWTDDDDIYWCNNIINKEYLNIYIN